MFYIHSVIVPRGTPRSAPLITEMALGPGEIHQVEIGFPWGCAGLVYVQIWKAEHQVWPTTPDTAFAWNDYNYVFEESEPCAGPAEPWSIRCWNLDERYSHVVQVHLGILSAEKTVLGKVAESLFGAAKR